MIAPLAGEALLAELIARGAVLDGHFRLSSGRHSNRFVQKFRILEEPAVVERIAAAFVANASGATIVVSAAVGGIVLGYETARQLGTKGIFVEKEAGVPTLRRGFHLDANDRVFIVEDVVTTGGSVREVLAVVRGYGARVAGVGVIVRRDPIDFGVPTHALCDLPIASYEPEACPSCIRGEALQEPGSRFLA